jgi:hypothetical protein
VPGIAREVAGVIRRYPLATVGPAVGLGVGAAGLHLVHGDLLAVVLVGLLLAIAFELYVAWVERLVLEFERGARRVDVAGLLRAARPLVPALLAASLLGVTLPLAASGLLVIPGLWLLTRWSLFAPVISKEGAGPVAAIRRSNELVRGHFWAVFATVTVSLLVEHSVIHATSQTADSLLGSQLLALAGAGLVVAAVSPPAALTISIVYDRLAKSPPGQAGAGSGGGAGGGEGGSSSGPGTGSGRGSIPR